jgi:hypothetical protein
MDTLGLMNQAPSSKPFNKGPIHKTNKALKKLQNQLCFEFVFNGKSQGEKQNDVGEPA